MGFDYIEYALQWLTILGGLALASPTLMSTYIILKNGGMTNVRRDKTTLKRFGS